MMNSSSWENVAQDVQEYRDVTLDHVEPPIPEVPSPLPQNSIDLARILLSERETGITETSTKDLVSSLASAKLSSTEVTNAFSFGAPDWHKNSYRISNFFQVIVAALARAQELDEYMKEHEKPLGPLHGLPISVKEHMGMKDLGLNTGLAAWAQNKAEGDAVVLKILWQAGCVFHARTTQPQTLMQLETSSNLYGVTVNPYNRKLTPGGSSGGEGALLGFRGSCLGVGSDIGGSIRVPAANNGLYGLRPTTRRIPLLGVVAPQVGSGYVEPVIGPLSTSLDGIKLFMRTVLAAKPWMDDPSLVPLGWRDDNSYLDRGSGKRLKVAVLWNDGVVTPHPPVQRALKDVVARLREIDTVEVVDWEPYKHAFAWELIAKLYFGDGGHQIKEAIASSGEPWRPLARFILPDNPHAQERSVVEIQDLKVQREQYCYEYAQKWGSTGTTRADKEESDEGIIDVILCPATPGVAPPLDSSRYWGYSSQWNLLDYPALVFPVTTVDPALDERDEGYEPKNEQDRFNHELYEGPEKLWGYRFRYSLWGDVVKAHIRPLQGFLIELLIVQVERTGHESTLSCFKF
ncbi:hypothetical protein G7Y79_00001g002890 [Physcia stellaris]|nr:hypothetical protein G7Y79_00001g002890 [Physcia stellaris]